MGGGCSDEKGYFIEPTVILAEDPMFKTMVEEIQGKLEAGESFEELAKAYSDCPSSQKGGDLGFFPRGTLVVPEVEEAAFTLSVGQISPVITTARKLIR